MRAHAATITLAFVMLLALRAHAAPPPGFNVYEVVAEKGHTFWRGGAPRTDTIAALVAAAKARKTTVTLIDLRHPANSDDNSGKGGRLSPSAEARAAVAAGAHYISISALDKELIPKLVAALADGDVYMHCMYGVNRTGFATARFATAENLKVQRTGLGPHDWQEGCEFQKQQKKPPATH